jgi:hypothetical protein
MEPGKNIWNPSTNSNTIVNASHAIGIILNIGISVLRPPKNVQ